jgi:hypothetical protein
MAKATPKATPKTNKPNGGPPMNMDQMMKECKKGNKKVCDMMNQMKDQKGK